MTAPPATSQATGGDAGYRLSLRLHHEIEALYPRIEAYGAFFRSLAPADRRLPHPPGVTPGVRLDPLVCALSVKAATTKRAVLALCESGDGDSAIVLARVMLENACLLEWLIRGEGRQRLESYAMFLSVVHERRVETIERHRVRFVDAEAPLQVSSSPYHRGIWEHTFREGKNPTKSDRATWDVDPKTGVRGPWSVKKLFEEVGEKVPPDEAANRRSFEYDVLYGAIGSDVVHSGPFSLTPMLREIGEGRRDTFWLRPAPSNQMCGIALGSSNSAMFLVLDSLTQYLGLDLSAELAPMKADHARNPYGHEGSA